MAERGSRHLRAAPRIVDALAGKEKNFWRAATSQSSAYHNRVKQLPKYLFSLSGEQVSGKISHKLLLSCVSYRRKEPDLDAMRTSFSVFGSHSKAVTAPFITTVSSVLRKIS